MLDAPSTGRLMYVAERRWPGLNDTSSSYLRIAAISIAAYDYFLTLPAEWRFYKVQRSWRPSVGCTLFILIRYVSLITVTVSAVGFFASFSPQSCQRWFMITPVFKVLQMIISQVIMGIRTVNISRRTPWVVWSLLVIFLIVAGLEFFTNLYGRNAVQDTHHNCTGGDNAAHLSVWLFYVVAMLYDVVAIGISTYFLMGFNSSSSRVSRLVRLMLYDGIGYFVLLTATNIVNLVFYRTSDETTQSSGACLSFAIVWIMSQKILIHLRDAASEHTRTTQVVTHSLHSPRSISHAMRSQFESKDQLDAEFGLPRPRTGSSSPERPSWGGEYEGALDVQIEVAVERSVTVEYTHEICERESHGTPWLARECPRLAS